MKVAIEFLNPVNRSMIFIIALLFLWIIEFGVPLAPRKNRKVLPNIFLTIVSLFIYSLFGLLLVSITNWASIISFGVYQWLEISASTMLIITILFLDFWAAYVVHVMMHKSTWFWYLHSVHHSDKMVDVTTSLRQHPGESILRNAFLVSGVALLGIPIWMVLIYQTLSSFAAQLEHANIRINPHLNKILNLVFVTPNFHKVHHSKDQEDTDTNYGNIFSIWDRCFLTYRKKREYNRINYGLDDMSKEDDLSFYQLLRLPFKRP